MEEDKPRVYDSDLDNDKEAKPEGEADKKEEKKKAPRKPLIKMDPGFLIDNPNGLKLLYKHSVIDAEKNLKMKGKGNELSDFNRVMRVMKQWHFEAMPKIEINYFAERVGKVGNDKAVKAFMSRLRNVYKGIEVMDDFIEQPTAQPEKPMFEYINTTTQAPVGQTSYEDDYYMQAQKEQPYFKLMDLPTGPSQPPYFPS